MNIIEILDLYIQHKSVDEIPVPLLKKLSSEPSSLVHNLLRSFHLQGCSFMFESIFVKPLDFDDAMDRIAKTDNVSEKYVLALFCLQYQHRMASSFVNLVLAKLEIM